MENIIARLSPLLMNRGLGLCLLFFFYSEMFAQSWKRSEVSSQWYFGWNAGLVYSDSGYVSTPGQLKAYEGCSTICDSVGNLLFYTDGVSVYNKIHQMMQNGDSLNGGMVQLSFPRVNFTSSVQGALIIPLPQSNNIYYILTANCSEDYDSLTPDSIMYSIVDLSMSGGLGAITSKNQLIYSNG